uniref:SFRICE_022818 n=1 Tax=Spodoptera frugiperda TaxID=7108 RepID=A0A2H1WCS7_SPOFR
MASFSLRLLTIFLLAALVLNISNYFFIKRYNPRPGLLRYVYTNFPSNVSENQIRRSLNPRFWSIAAGCDSEVTTASSPKLNAYDSEKLDISSSVPPSSVYSVIFEKTSQAATEPTLQNCPEMPPGLGPELSRSHDVKSFIEDRINNVLPGGIYQPENCKSLQSVAVIIAYRGCKSYLNVFMNVLHPFLIKQQLDYRVFVVEQSNKTQPFNRGKLINVGFAEAMRYRKDGYQCIILHDPYIIPTDTRNLYRCSWYPRQLAALIERPQK